MDHRGGLLSCCACDGYAAASLLVGGSKQVKERKEPEQERVEQEEVEQHEAIQRGASRASVNFIHLPCQSLPN